MNSGLMSLKQAINVIMGANIGTTVTAWLLSLAGIDKYPFFYSVLFPNLVDICLYVMPPESGLVVCAAALIMFSIEKKHEMHNTDFAKICFWPIWRFWCILRTLLGRLTTNRAAGLVTGLAVTAIIQSSSAATVMVVGFVNSGLMSLKQAINVIMGANIGTTEDRLDRPEDGQPHRRADDVEGQVDQGGPLGVPVGYMSGKNTKRQDTGTILLGFATLMFGMETIGWRSPPGR